jgi:tRNA pseudouridine38-40 synthase
MRYRAVLAYIGTDFHGWQAQKNAARTVQAVLETALEKLAGGPVRVRASGRTDAGVHAEGQVVDFELPGAREPSRVLAAVNAMLPRDARLLEVEAAAPGFDARRDAVWKEYLYRWSRAAVIPPRDLPYVAPISAAADVERMRQTAAPLVGTHDFRVFAVAGGAAGGSVRALHFIRIDERGAEIRALFRGDAFLRGMVRSICGVLADAARGRLPADRALRLLETGDRSLLAPKAPARGLTLVRVRYRSRARRPPGLRSDPGAPERVTLVE